MLFVKVLTKCVVPSCLVIKIAWDFCMTQAFDAKILQ